MITNNIFRRKGIVDELQFIVKYIPTNPFPSLRKIFNIIIYITNNSDGIHEE